MDCKDMSGPVVRLETLTPEDIYILLTKLRDIMANGNPSAYLIPDEGIQMSMNTESDGCPANLLKENDLQDT